MLVLGYMVLGYVVLAGLLCLAGYRSYRASLQLAEDRRRAR